MSGAGRKRPALFMTCTKPIYIHGEALPCGSCIACRIHRTREWGERIMHEIIFWDTASFVTLTYSDLHLPFSGSLCKRDYQLFIKRLRKVMSPKLIKYFACGEYGPQTWRPHYHAILFGVNPVADSDLVRDSWSSGFVTISLVNEERSRYVAGYIKDKLTGEKGKIAYEGIEAPFLCMSQGIGKRWFEQNIIPLQENCGYKIKGVSVGMPRYYRKLLGDSYNQPLADAKKVERADEHLRLSRERHEDPLKEWKRIKQRRDQRNAELETMLARKKHKL